MTFSFIELLELETLLESGRPMPMRDLARLAEHDPVDPDIIGVRHDVDDDLHLSVAFAHWEHERGISASYFILPTAPYWNQPRALREAVEVILGFGHEIGLHNDAYHEMALASGGESELVAETALTLLHAQAAVLKMYGADVVGCADHGSGAPLNVNLWDPEKHGRTPDEAGFEYECYLLQRQLDVTYISDNGGTWRAPRQRQPGKPTVVLVHPQHWRLP